MFSVTSQNGDLCENKPRIATVRFVCSGGIYKSTEINSVTVEDRCKTVIEFGINLPILCDLPLISSTTMVPQNGTTGALYSTVSIVSTSSVPANETVASTNAPILVSLNNDDIAGLRISYFIVLILVSCILLVLVVFFILKKFIFKPAKENDLPYNNIEFTVAMENN